ncbi:hypothetical protein BH10PSE2_BH10PSE2_27330 [soil metagenome]
MIHREQFERLRRAFADQFTPDRAGAFYRKGGKGPAIRVNATERDDFIADYDRHLRLLAWTTVGATVVASLAFGAFALGRGVPGWISYAGIAFGIALFVGAHQWIRDAPARALSYRIPNAPALSRLQQGQAVLAKLTYTRLLWLVGVTLFAVFNAARAWDIRHGWARLWIAFGVVMIALASIQAFRKWRMERADRI